MARSSSTMPKTDTDLKLVFDEVKLVRGMRGYGWFPNVIFHDVGEPKKKYAIDFWFKPDGDKLQLVDIRVQKGPRREGDGYTMITRLPVAWWWLPVSEHPGDTEIVRHWQVMSAIHGEIASKRDKDGVYYLKDEKNGQTIPLRVHRDPPADPPPQEGRPLLRLHGFPQARQQGRVLRRRLLARRKGRQAEGRRSSHPQGAGAGGRHLDAEAPLHVRRS